MNWYWALTFLLLGSIITIITLAAISIKMTKPKKQTGKSGINSIVEQDETVVTVLNPKSRR